MDIANWNSLTFLKGFIEKSQWKTTILFAYVFFAICTWKSAPILPDVSAAPPECFTTFVYGTWKIGLAALLFGLIPMGIVKFVFRESLTDYGVSLGIIQKTVKSALLCVPVFAITGWLSGSEIGFQSVYPLNPCASWGIWTSSWFILHATTYLFLYYFSYEFFFRGFIQHGISDSCGIWNAILIQSLISTFFHIGHPMCELWGAFFGSLLWGFFVVRNQSLISGWLQHASLGILVDARLIMY